MGVTRLQEPGELGWHNDGPNLMVQAPGQHCCRYVYPSSIQQEDGLQSIQVGPECKGKHGDNSGHQLLVVPCTLLPDEVDVPRESCLQSGKIPDQESRLVPHQHLWEQGLDVGPVAYESSMGEASPSLGTRGLLIRLITGVPSPLEDDCSLPSSLK